MSEPSSPRGARGQYSRGYLPHFDHEAVLQMVTFRLVDALPTSIARSRPPPSMDLEAELDRGYGSCVLRRPDVAGIVRGALRHFEGQRYDLGPWVIMPNHVHLLLRPHSGHALANIVHSWKSFTAKQINALTGNTGSLWQREYFDRMIRTQRHLVAATRYIHENPVAAGLVDHPEQWAWSSAAAPHAGETPAARRQDAGAPSNRSIEAIAPASRRRGHLGRVNE